MPIEKRPVQGDPGFVAGIPSVEMRRPVITKEHQDGDSVKLADSRHLSTV
jgi:hypothetical protein